MKHRRKRGISFIGLLLMSVIAILLGSIAGAYYYLHSQYTGEAREEGLVKLREMDENSVEYQIASRYYDASELKEPEVELAQAKE